MNNNFFLDNLDLHNKGVVARFDFNVPIVKETISDDFRITSTLPTIESILSKNPKYLILTSHLGRPKGRDLSKSLKIIIPILQKYLKRSITFLEKGISQDTLDIIDSGVYLLENLRFHEEETSYDKITDKDENNCIKLYRKLGDVYISDAFGCLHRKHMSIYDMKYSGKEYGYGYLIKKEVDAIDKILITNKNILGIIGGNKISDKMPLIKSLASLKKSTIFVAGGLAKQYNEDINNVVIMNDGYGSDTLENKEKIYIENYKNTSLNIYDIGDKSLRELKDMITQNDIIFWNGSLGVIEDERYKVGSNNLVEYLQMECSNKYIVIGGGETASLFEKNVSHIYVSTGGGALLEYVQNIILFNKTLPGLEIFS